MLFYCCTHLVYAPAHEKDEEIKWQAKNDARCLQGSKGVVPTRDKQSSCNCTFGERPENALNPMMLFCTVTGKSVNNKASRVWRGDKVDGESNDTEATH